MASPFCSRKSHDKADLIRLIGARMRTARELCNLTQQEAARRLGYGNSSRLAKIEGAIDIRIISLSIIIAAAKIYDVSADYLLGLSDDWDSDSQRASERAISGWLFDTWEKAREKDLAALGQLRTKIRHLEQTVGVLLDDAASTEAALDTFMTRNPEFDDMQAGSRLVMCVHRTAESARQAQARFARFQTELKVNVCDRERPVQMSFRSMAERV